jgi:hypothetical protein
MPAESRSCLAASALEARAALDGRGRWRGAVPLLDAALDALGEPDPLVIVTDGGGAADTRVLAVGRDAIALAAHTPTGVRAARYVLEGPA